MRYLIAVMTALVALHEVKSAAEETGRIRHAKGLIRRILRYARLPVVWAQALYYILATWLTLMGQPVY